MAIKLLTIRIREFGKPNWVGTFTFKIEGITLDDVGKKLRKLSKEYYRDREEELVFEYLNLVEYVGNISSDTMQTLGIREFPPNIDNIWR